MNPATLNLFCYALFLMAAGHAVCDRPLQYPLLRSEKNGSRAGTRWIYGLGCHALIHGGAVCLITGSWHLGVAEMLAHAAIDEAKCRGKIGLVTDQALHLVCKVLWALAFIAIAD